MKNTRKLIMFLQQHNLNIQGPNLLMYKENTWENTLFIIGRGEGLLHFFLLQISISDEKENRCCWPLHTKTAVE